MKFQRPKLVRIEYNRTFLFQTGKFQYPYITQNVCKSSHFAAGHLQLKGRMVLETSLLSQLNNTKQSREICLTCFFSSLSLSESSLDLKLQNLLLLFIYTHCCRSSWTIHMIIDIVRWHYEERMLCR